MAENSEEEVSLRATVEIHRGKADATSVLGWKLEMSLCGWEGPKDNRASGEAWMLIWAEARTVHCPGGPSLCPVLCGLPSVMALEH